jgi:uncharacterized membrane protein
VSTTSTVVLVLAVFGASTVEMVEALTIVVAAGTTRGWRSALEGSATALAVLALLVGVVGVPLVHYVPLDALRVVVGALLLVLGLSWLRKAILRASGHKAKHDEDAIYAETAADLGRVPRQGSGRDGVGFAVAFKGVFLEGTEVVLIVVSLGASQHRLGLAAVAAGAAAVIVAGVGMVVARQLSAVPENTIKTAVGIMLSSFGLFWVGEGAGVRWPGSDLFILAFIAIFAVVTAASVARMRIVRPGSPVTDPAPSEVSAGPPAVRVVSPLRRGLDAFGRFWWDFLIGDTPELFLATLVIVGTAYALRHDRVAAVVVEPLLAIGMLVTSTYRGRRRVLTP